MFRVCVCRAELEYLLQHVNECQRYASTRDDDYRNEKSVAIKTQPSMRYGVAVGAAAAFATKCQACDVVVFVVGVVVAAEFRETAQVRSLGWCVVMRCEQRHDLHRR